MQPSEEVQLLRVFIGESDRWNGTPLSAAIVREARELGLFGATVLKGSMGFGANSRVHTTKIPELSGDLPVVIEIVDTAERIQQMLPFLDEVIQERLVTIEDVTVLRPAP